MDRYQILEDLRKWLAEQHRIASGYEGWYEQHPGEAAVFITAYSCVLDKIEELEYEHE